MAAGSHLTIYAMVGPMGAGKTTFALNISKDRGALFLSLDKTIKDFGQVIRSLQDYELHMKKALEVIESDAFHALKNGQSVVLDFGGGIGHWRWLKNIADSTGANIEIYQFEVPLRERLARVRKRNEEKPQDVYFFSMSDEEVVGSAPTRETPPADEGVKIIKITAAT